MRSHILLSMTVGLLGSRTVSARVACRLSSSSAYNAMEVTPTSSVTSSGLSVTIEKSTPEGSSSTTQPSTEISVIETTSPTDLATAPTSTAEPPNAETSTISISIAESSTSGAPTPEIPVTEDATSTLAAETTTQIVEPAATTTTAEPANPTALSVFRVSTGSGKYIQANSASRGSNVQLRTTGNAAFTIAPGTNRLQFDDGNGQLCASYTSFRRAYIQVCQESVGERATYLTCSQAPDHTLSCSITGKTCSGMGSCPPTGTNFDTFYSEDGDSTGTLWLGVSTGVGPTFVQEVLSAADPVTTV